MTPRRPVGQPDVHGDRRGRAKDVLNEMMYHAAVAGAEYVELTTSPPTRAGTCPDGD
jgi:hypothetical protein